MTRMDQLNTPGKLLKVESFGGSQWILPEEWNDYFKQFLARTNNEPVKMLFVIVVTLVGVDVTNPKEFPNLLQASNAFGTLRDSKLVTYLKAGLVAFSSCPVRLPDETDGEAPFPVYKTNNPTKLNQPFLLIVRTQHVVTTFRLVAWDSRVFQQIAEC